MKRIIALSLSILLLLGLTVQPLALEPEGSEETPAAKGETLPEIPETDSKTPADAPEEADTEIPVDESEEPAVQVPEASEEGQTANEPAPPAEEGPFDPPGESMLLQDGSFNIAQTLPDEPRFFAGNTLYDQIYECLRNKGTKLDIEPSQQLPVKEFSKIFYRVVNDHPEMFYVEKFMYWGSEAAVTAIQPVYRTSIYGKSVETATAEFNAAANIALAQVNDSMTELEKALVLHDYLVVHCRYNWRVAAGPAYEDTDEVNGGTPWMSYGALVLGDAVCQGYALAYKYLLNQVGIPSVYVASDAMNHAWNMVYLNGNWYHVDATWDDPTPNLEGACKHGNFLRSDSGIEETGHRGWEQLYTCSSTAYESGGYIFNDLAFPVYYQDGAYYYIKKTAETIYDYYGKYALYKGPLNGTGTQLTTLNAYIHKETSPAPNGGTYWNGYPDNFGIVWHEGALYYVNKDRTLERCVLSDPDNKTQIGSAISFQASASADAKYKSLLDAFALRYGNGNVVVYSRTRPDSILATISLPAIPTPPKYPEEWDNDQQHPTKTIVGTVNSQNNKTSVGIKWDGEKNANVWLAFYDPVTKRMKSIESYTVSLKNGVNLVELRSALKTSDEVRVILVGKDVNENNMPLCGLFKPQN